MHQDVQDRCSFVHDSKLLCAQETPAKSSQSSEVCFSGRCERLPDLMDCKGDVWAVLQEMSGNAHPSVVNSSILFTQPWLIFVTLLSRLDYRVGIDLQVLSPRPKMSRTFLM